MTAEKFKGLPLGELIGAPLQAASDAQKKLAESTFEFNTKNKLEKNDPSATGNLSQPIEAPKELNPTNGK